MKAVTPIAVEDLGAPPSRKLLRSREASRYLALSPRALWALSNSGSIPTVRIGLRTVRFDIDDLNDWIDSQKAGRR